MARRSRRRFTAEFKAKVVLDLLAGHTTPAEVCRKHQRSPSRLALWKAGRGVAVSMGAVGQPEESGYAERLSGRSRRRKSR